MSGLFPEQPPDFGPPTPEEIARIGRISKALVEAALANRCVREDAADLTLHPPVRGKEIRANPPVKVEYEHAYVIAPLGDALFAGRNKPTFGKLLSVLPVGVDDPVHPHRVLYVYKESSTYNRRVEQRKWLKRKLGKGARRLVTLAMRENKGDFLGLVEDPRRGWPDGRAVIEAAFGMDAGRFWRVARGREMIEIPRQPQQAWLPF